MTATARAVALMAAVGLLFASGCGRDEWRRQQAELLRRTCVSVAGRARPDDVGTQRHVEAIPADAFVVPGTGTPAVVVFARTCRP